MLQGGYVLLFLSCICIFLALVDGFYLSTSMNRASAYTSSSSSTDLHMSTSTSTTPFVKYQGLGNDFILIDNTKESSPIFTPEEAMKICDRNFGIGGDGVIFAMSGTNGCDYTMRIYNSDGSEPEMCGNGIRCMARFLLEVEGKDKFAEETYTISTGAGRIIPKIIKDGSITVDMGEPILAPADEIPTTLAATSKEGYVVDADIEACGKKYKINAISMGNPHGVIFMDNLDEMDPAFEIIGPAIESHPAWPEKVNAEFAQVLSDSHIRMKVWERGAGPTLACGTGACATCIAGVLSGRTGRKSTISLPGGDLHIEWRESDNKVYMTGPAEAVFRGHI